MKLQILVLTGALLLSACASDPSRNNDAALRPADRPECQVASSSSSEALARSQSSAMVRDPCRPNDTLEWSSGKQDTIKPNFSGKHD